ncbi:CHRD domain-containing protein [soil metagenome]
MSATPTSLLRKSMALGAIATLALAAGCSNMMKPMGGVTSFGAALTSAAEVPPNSSGGSGTLEATLDKSTNILKWKLVYSGLTGPATMAHFHGPAMAGVNAGVVVPFASAASPSEGQATLTPAQVADLMDGKWYANVHTAVNPGGEIRGQVTSKPSAP